MRGTGRGRQRNGWLTCCVPYDRDWANLAGVGTGGHESRDRSFVGLDPGELWSFSLRQLLPLAV